MSNFVMPKHTGQLKEFIAPLKVCYERRNYNDGWIPNGNALKKEEGFTYYLSQEYNDTTPKSDNSDYTKDAQIPLYLGFLEGRGRNNEEKRITAKGIQMYEAIKNGNKIEQFDLLINAFETVTFGRNNLGFPSCDTDIEVPNILVLSSVILNGILRVEFYYILYVMHIKKWDLARAVSEIIYLRNTSNDVPNIPNIYTDCKLIPLFVGMEFLEDRDKFIYIKSNVYKQFSQRIHNLRPTNSLAENTLSSGIQYVDENYCNYFLPLRTKPFLLLAGISGTGKSRIVRELAYMSCPKVLQDKDGTTPGNYCMVEVKPNWHDSTELLGYYSNIRGKYIFTPFVKFLIKAMKYPDIPFFVCLDEMNLAPVEQYFAEFLSVLETRKLCKSERILSTPIIKKEFFKPLEGLKTSFEYTVSEEKNEVRRITNEIKNDLDIDSSTDELICNELLEKGLTLPDNVFVIGTVNMDDTTYKFSRKVIDRAMTIEMNGGRLHDMFGKSAQLSYRSDEDVVPLSVFKPKYVTADDAISECSAIESFIEKVTASEENPASVSGRLKAINDCLEGTPFQISYRVLNELVIYLAVLLDNEEGDVSEERFEELLNAAIDNIVLMKILPRIEGDYEMFECKDSNGLIMKDTKLDRLLEVVPENGKSYKKIVEMKDRLTRSSFTRFWP